MGETFYTINLKSNFMKQILTKAYHAFFFIAFLTIAFSCQKSMNDPDGSNSEKAGRVNLSKELKNFVPVNLVGDNDQYHPVFIDPGLINPWGIAFPSSGPAMISTERNGTAKSFTLDGNPGGSFLSIPLRSGSLDPGHPSGVVFNPTSDFILPNGNPAKFIFASVDGTVAGWNLGSSAVCKIEMIPGGAYMGIALANVGSDFFLYAANFAQNRIDVFDKDWKQVSNKQFIDPDLPAGYSPYNIQVISDGKLYVMYAKKDANGKREIGAGNGYINVFSPNGTLLKRFASKGKLNAPWGITMAPAGFWGEFSQTQLSNIILVGNNGDGHINAFDEDGNFIGPLTTKGKAIEIEGLWGITFPPITGLNRYYLYFASGPGDETHGLIGYIKNAFLN